MYNALDHFRFYGCNTEQLHNIRDYECYSLYPKARELMEEVRKERTEKNLPFRLGGPVLVSRKMKKLPEPNIKKSSV